MFRWKSISHKQFHAKIIMRMSYFQVRSGKTVPPWTPPCKDINDTKSSADKSLNKLVAGYKPADYKDYMKLIPKKVRTYEALWDDHFPSS